MANRRDLTVEDASVPLPPPSLVNGEDGAAYDQLAARIMAAVAPENVIEEIWVRDVVDLVWDVVRLRRLKAGLFTVGASDGAAFAQPLLAEPDAGRWRSMRMMRTVGISAGAGQQVVGERR